MVDVNLKNTFSYYNNIFRMDGMQKCAEGEFAAQVYVIVSKIKKKILLFGFKNKETLFDKIDKWNNVRCLMFSKKYMENKNIWDTITKKEFDKAIKDVSNIKITQKNKLI